MSVELVLVVRFPLWCWFLPLPFLLPVKLHPVIICTRRSISRWCGRIRPKVSRGVTPLQQGCAKSCAVGNCTQLQAASKKDRGHIHHHCVLDCMCQRSSRSTFPLFDVKLPGSQTWFKTFRVITPRFRRRHDLLHQGILSILSVWRVSTLYWSPCLSSVGFLHGSDQGSYTAFRYQGQRMIHLHATLQVSIAQCSHCCQGDRISLNFASFHHLVRNRNDEGSWIEILGTLHRFHRTTAARPGLRGPWAALHPEIRRS